MLSLITIAFFTLSTMADFVGSFQLSTFVKGSFYLKRTVDGSTVTYYVPVTTIKETLSECIKGFFALYNVSVSASDATNIAFALATSVLKVVVFIVDMILILTLGNLFSLLSWYLIFRHFIPRIARKTVKLRWLGMLETMVTFVVVTVLFFTPFTALVNSVNQSYKRIENRQESNSQLVQNVGSFIDAYDKSLFAKVLFNWTVDDSGMTFDTRLFNSLTTGVSGEYSVGIVSEFANIANTIAMCSGAINSEGSEIVVDYTALVTKEIVDQAFESMMNSELLADILPIAVEIALNSDLLENYIPTRLVDLSDVTWKDELGYVRDMVDCVFESGAIERLFFINEETGKREMRSLQGSDLYNFIEEVVNSDDEHFDHILDMFKSIDESKVLSRAVPALIQFALDNDKEGNVKQFLPYTWEELNEFSWGFEMYVLLDFLHSTIKLDDDFLKAIFIQSGVYQEDPSVKKLDTLISEHADEFKKLVVGDFVWNDTKNEFEPRYPNRLDKNGRTIVFDDNGNRQSDNNVPRHYCFFDMNLVNKTVPYLLDNLFDLDGLKDIRAGMNDDDLNLFHESVAQLSTKDRLLNYKGEFYAVLDVVATAAEDEQLVSALLTGKGLTPLMEEEGNYFSISMTHINKFRDAIAKMGKSKVLYSALAPMLKNLLSQSDITQTFGELGLDNTILVSAIDHDIKATNHTLFADFSDLLSHWGDLKNIYSLSSLSETTEIMDQLKTPEGESESPVIKSLVNILTAIHDNKLLNPTPQSGDTYVKNANLYGLLDYIFEMTQDTGLIIDKETIRSIPDNKWDDEFKAVGHILSFIADHDLLSASTAFTDGLNRTGLNDLRSGGKYDIPQLFDKVNKSVIFSSSFGKYLDDLFGDALSGFLIDDAQHISFANVSDWSIEGHNISNLLDSFYNILPESDEEANDLIKNFDISKFTNVVELNDMLHDLAHSGIFTYVDEHGDSHYQFGKWLYSKVESSLSSFPTGDSTNQDLLADPTFGTDSLIDWKESWGIRPEDSSVNADPYFTEWRTANEGASSTHYIAYRDFACPNNIDDIVTETDNEIIDFWCNYDEFKARQNSFLTAHKTDLTSTYLTNDWGAYFASENFIADYGSGVYGYNVFEVDEISRIVKFLTYSMKLMAEKTDHTKMAFNDMDSALLSDMLKAVNETYCFRVCLYNFYQVAADFNFDSSSSFSLEGAYSTYMIDAEYEVMDFVHARPDRQKELDKLVAIFDVVKKINDNNVFSGNTFQFNVLKETGLVDELKSALKGLHDSLIFHQNGSTLVNKPTAFQSLFNYLLGESDVKDMIYIGNNSPKDKYYISQPSPLYTDAKSKVEYLVNNTFLDDAGIDALIALDPTVNKEERQEKQKGEIDKLFDVVDTLYSLTNSSGQPVTTLDEVDLSNSTNSETVISLLDLLNSSDLLYDVVPNSIYKLFAENSSISFDTGSGAVDFGRVDPFYHYYYNLDNLTKLTVPNFQTRYKPSTEQNSDLKYLGTILTDYQNFDEALGDNDINDCTILLSLIDTDYDNGIFECNGSLPILLKDMHDCHLFHSPARNYGSGYYTSQFEDGLTIFEDMMSKVCAAIGLDVSAYETAYDVPRGFNNSDEKLTYNIKQVTHADDGYTSICVYHNNQDHAWHDEINALMEIMYKASEMSPTQTIDIANFTMDTLTPLQIKEMLTSVNYSNLVCDAVSSFVKDGFVSMDLDNLTTYNSICYANYHLGQVAYGGLNGLSGTGSEIDNIYHVSTVLRDENGNFADLSNITSFIENDDANDTRLTALFRFVYESKILDTPVNGNYRDYNIVSGHQISGQGVLLYNVLDSSGLSGFIARDALTTTTEESTILERIEQLSTIIHMPYEDDDAIADGLTYQIESKGLSRLIKETSNANIDADSFTGSGNEDINNVQAYETPILNIITCAYDADGNGHRSALVSEFVSGLLNNVLENEYNSLNSKVGYAFNQFTFGKPQTEPLVKYSHYASLNVIERNGLQGILDSLAYVNQLSDPNFIAGMSDADRHALADGIEGCFALMTTEVGENHYNSEIGRIIYLNNVHDIFKLFAIIPNNEMHTFASSLVDASSTSTSSGSNTVYSQDFYFSNYGTAFKNYVYPGFFTI